MKVSSEEVFQYTNRKVGTDMSHTYIITHDVISSHQLRAYGDTVYEGYMTFTVPDGQMVGSGYLRVDNDFTRQKVKDYLRVLVVDFVDNKKTNSDDWYLPHLQNLRYLGDGKWHYYITRHYLD